MNATTSTFPNPNQVSSVYNGKSGKCCCGCSGKHRYASLHREWASKHRGYPVTDDEVSNRVVKQTYDKVRRAYDHGEEIDFWGSYVAWDDGSRIHILYIKGE